MRILIILLFFSSSIFAQIEEENPDADLSKFLLVGAFETKLVSLAMNQRINKSILMIASKQRDYSLLLSRVRPKDVTATTYEIKLLLKPQGKLFRIEVQLVNVNSA